MTLIDEYQKLKSARRKARAALPMFEKVRVLERLRERTKKFREVRQRCDPRARV